MLDPATRALVEAVIITERSLGAEILPHQVPHRSSPLTGVEAYSCTVHKSMSLLGSTAVALQSPQWLMPRSSTKNLASPVFRTVSARNELKPSASILKE